MTPPGLARGRGLPIYLAVLIGRIVSLISAILASFPVCDKALCATP